MKRRGFIAGVLGLLGFGAITPAPLPAKSYVGELKVGPVEKLWSPGYRLRLWKLGSIEDKVMPTDKAFENLGKILGEWDRESDLDLIWGPYLTCEEFCGNNSVNIIAPPSVEITKMDDGNLKISIKGEGSSM